MKKSIKALILFLITISFNFQSQTSLSLKTSWNVQYSKEFPKGSHKLTYDTAWDSNASGYMNEMKYTMEIMEDTRNGNVFLNIGSSDTMFVNKYANKNFKYGIPTTYKLPKLPSANDWSVNNNPLYDITTFNTFSYGNEYHFALGDTVYRNQLGAFTTQTSTYSTHPFNLNPNPRTLLKLNTSAIGNNVGANDPNFITKIFNHHMSKFIRYDFNNNIIRLYNNTDTAKVYPNFSINTVTLTCPFNNSKSTKIMFQYKNDSTMYVKYLETFLAPNNLDYEIRSIYVDTLSIINGDSLVIGNYFHMDGMQNNPTLSFEYSNIYCSGTEVYMLTSNSTRLQNVDVFGTQVEFAKPYLFCFSTSTVQITDPATSISEIQKATVYDMVAYPNPSDGQFTLKFDTREQALPVEVYDIQGKMIYSDNAERSYHNEILINISDRAKGIYIVKVGTKFTKINVQ